MLLIPFIDNLGNSHTPFFIVREIQKKYVLYMKKNWLLLIKYIIGILSRIFGYKKNMHIWGFGKLCVHTSYTSTLYVANDRYVVCYLYM